MIKRKSSSPQGAAMTQTCENTEEKHHSISVRKGLVEEAGLSSAMKGKLDFEP